MRQNENFWYGSTVTSQSIPFFFSRNHHTFLSVEPISEPFDKIEEMKHLVDIDWIIIGAETGNRKDKPVPKHSWFNSIVDVAVKTNIPVFMKDSLTNIVGEDNILRLIPEEMKKIVYSEETEKKLFADCGICHETNRKSEMHTILSKRSRNEGAKVIGYVCDNCYPNFKGDFKG